MREIKLLKALRNRIARSRYMRDEQIISELEKECEANLPTDFLGYNVALGKAIVRKLGQETTIAEILTNGLIIPDKSVGYIGNESRGGIIFNPAINKGEVNQPRLRKSDDLYPFVSVGYFDNQIYIGANQSQKVIVPDIATTLLISLCKLGKEINNYCLIYWNYSNNNYHIINPTETITFSINSTYNTYGSDFIVFNWLESLDDPFQTISYQNSDGTLWGTKNTTHSYCSLHSRDNEAVDFICNDRDFENNNYTINRNIINYIPQGWVGGIFNYIILNGTLTETDARKSYYQLRDQDLGFVLRSWNRYESIDIFSRNVFDTVPNPDVLLETSYDDIKQVIESEIFNSKIIINNSKTIDYEAYKREFLLNYEYHFNSEDYVSSLNNGNTNFIGDICTILTDTKQYKAFETDYSLYIVSIDSESSIYSVKFSQNQQSSYSNLSTPNNYTVETSTPTYRESSHVWMLLNFSFPNNMKGNLGQKTTTYTFDFTEVGNKPPKYYLAEGISDTELATDNSWYIDLYGINLWGTGLTIPEELPTNITINLLDEDGDTAFFVDSKFDTNGNYNTGIGNGLFLSKFNYWEQVYTENWTSTVNSATTITPVGTIYQNIAAEDHSSLFFDNLVGQSIVLIESTGINNQTCNAWEGAITSYTYQDQNQSSFGNNGFEDFNIVRVIKSLNIDLSSKFELPFDYHCSYQNSGKFALYSSNYTYFLCDRYKGANNESNLIYYQDNWYWFTWYGSGTNTEANVIAYKLNPDTLEFNLDRSWPKKNKNYAIKKHNLANPSIFSFYPA